MGSIRRTSTAIGICGAVAAAALMAGNALTHAQSATPAAANGAATASTKMHFDVRDFGAAGDGTTTDTEAINAAIEAAGKAGGGTVYFGAGTYVSYSIHLQSNVGFYLDQGAVLRAAGTVGGRGGGRGRGTTTAPAGAGGAEGPTDVLPFLAAPAGPVAGGRGPAGPKVTTWDAPEPNQWDAFQDYGHSHFHNSLMWGENLHDISIMGPGMLDGAGLTTSANSAASPANKILALKQCRNVTLRDVSFYRGGHFCILANAVDNFTIDNVKFDTNRDAADIVSCKNVRMSNCYVNSPNDDGICLKSDFALGEARPCENITITNCQVSGYAVGSLLNGTFDRGTTRAPDSDGPTGRIKFGTESNGGFKNITISNCVFDHCRGLAIETVDGGVIEDVTVSNITMREIFNPPIYIRLGDRHRGPAGTPVGQIRRINISNISAQALNPTMPVLISGMPDHPIEDVRLSNIRIVYPGGGTAQQAAVVPPERERQDYPEPSRLGPLPASAFFVRHVTGLEMHHIDVTYKAADARPALVLTDVAGADFQHLNVQRFDNVGYFALHKVTDFSTQYVRGLTDQKRDQAADELISK